MIRLFAHRGFHSQNVAQNSIASLNAAYQNKFRAIEFDIWFLEGKLVLKHDFPTKDEIKNLANFRDYFSFKNHFSYWLDFKNLDENNAKEALFLVKKELDEAAINMDQVYFAPFITDYKIAAKIFAEMRRVFGENIQLVAVCEKLENEKALHEFLQKDKIKFLSIFHGLLDKAFVKKFSGIEIFAWTINDLKTLKELEALGVRNFATDKITPQDYDKNSSSPRPQIAH